MKNHTMKGREVDTIEMAVKKTEAMEINACFCPNIIGDCIICWEKAR